MDIEITFINKSSDKNNSEVVIFQKNVATSFEETAVAWKVIKNSGLNDTHKFLYSNHFDVSIVDSSGNHSNLQPAETGQKWDVVGASSGYALQLDSENTTNDDEVEVNNSLPTGSIDAEIYKNGDLLATKTSVSPGQKAVFEFKPTIYVGVASDVEEGKVMPSAVLAKANQELSLYGIKTANLVMTGGGTGPNATPFQFELEPTS